jgi:5-methylcytosine-specific restriction protein B
MANLCFGKFSQTYPEQLEGKFYAAGPEGTSWYGNIRPGDYVFPLFGGKVAELWKMARYVEQAGSDRRQKGRAEFEVVKTFPEPIGLSDGFIPYKYFELNLNMLNKSVKSVKNLGFLPITTTTDAPNPEKMDFREVDIRKLYIAHESAIPDSGSFKDGDIRVLITNSEHQKPGSIVEIQEYQSGSFTRYEPLMSLYEERNIPGERYSLNELLEWSREDGATKKEKYLRAVIDDLEEGGIYLAVSAVALYDNVLVGRKRSATSNRAVKPQDTTLTAETIDLSEDIDAYDIYRQLLEHNPNMILYGPPGTGKTFAIEKIVENMEQHRTGTYIDFHTIQEEKRVEFLTFHQSFSYEEFVEGIRPVLDGYDSSEQDANTSSLGYRIEDGILKRLASRASVNRVKEEEADIPAELSPDSRVYKISLGRRHGEDEIYKFCRDNSLIAIGWLESHDLSEWDYDKIFDSLKSEREEGSQAPTNDASSVDFFVNQISTGDIVVVYEGKYTIRDIVVVSEEYRYQPDSASRYPHRRKVKWLRHFDEPVDIRNINNGKRLTMKTVYPLRNVEISDLEPFITKIGSGTGEHSSANKALPHYLVIDEINRGNISKIFGELITLIEADKRNKISVRLPYSRKPFTLPKNLYIIGTMNTADRSIAIIDTALRRRFVFMEVEPAPSVLAMSDTPSVAGKIDLEKLLTTLNKRIVEKFDRDHRIGHAYFMDLNNLEAFRITWYYKIIPLLMEYFYNDGKTISEIIGTAFIDPMTCQVKPLSGNALIDSIQQIYQRTITAP